LEVRLRTAEKPASAFTEAALLSNTTHKCTHTIFRGVKKGTTTAAQGHQAQGSPKLSGAAFSRWFAKPRTSKRAKKNQPS